MSDFDNTGIKKILTPDQLPSVPSALPRHNSTHGSTHNSTHPSMQSVLKHNEDLMARLSVSLRRIGHLEKVIEELTLRAKTEKSSADHLRDEVLIHNEKNRLSEKQLQKIIGDLNKKNERIEILEQESISLQSELKKLDTEYEFKISGLELEIHDLQKAKDESETLLKPQLLKLKSLGEKQIHTINEISNKNNELKNKLLELGRQAHEESMTFQSEISRFKAIISEKENKLIELYRLDEKYKKTVKEKIHWENKAIDLEHDLKRTNTMSQDEIESLTQELKLKTEDVHKLKIENYELKKDWSESHKKSKDLESRISSYEEQNNSMKYMWQEKTKKNEELENQLRIYETMRHELSTKIKNFESDVNQKNRKINELLKVIETMRDQGMHEKEAIIDTAVRGMKDLYFKEDDLPSTDIIKSISF